jgi:hypothetical protein
VARVQLDFRNGSAEDRQFHSLREALAHLLEDEAIAVGYSEHYRKVVRAARTTGPVDPRQGPTGRLRIPWGGLRDTVLP